jgi:hypothetical protein
VRLIGIVIALYAVVWLVKSYGVLSPKHGTDATSSAIEKAREAEKKSDSYNAQLATASQEASQAVSRGGSVTENMTPGQVRGLLGEPDQIEQTTSDTGKAQERWIYRSVGRTVLFENGIAISIQ